MQYLPHLFENNRAWVEKMTAQDPDFFRRLAQDGLVPDGSLSFIAAA